MASDISTLAKLVISFHLIFTKPDEQVCVHYISAKFHKFDSRILWQLALLFKFSALFNLFLLGCG